ncbi:hypothetical protein [Desulfofundulus thermocisternus]|uniref:hypothetical protein n=1 Tax=Desulfofundulus thermocisternus TaxID=42471 RepID=UPI00217E6B51|nr:hypothetical protein [Desulfofundulus thermocisternus]MCS5697347.1 hypothetical protein [Desulfofundulus thermocisternus]
MTSSEAGGRAEYEFRLIKGVMVGVSGPAVLLIRTGTVLPVIYKLPTGIHLNSFR